MRLQPFRSWPESLLQFLEIFWRGGIRLEQWRRKRREAAGEWPLRLSVPVISVGNITVGGTGKTPVTEALARQWISRGGFPGIVSRGYRGGDDGNDEYLMLKKRLPEVPHVQNRCRYQAGMQLLGEFPDTDLILMDDGFQHRRLHRDLDLVLLDGQDPLGGGRCLPLGSLREPWTNLDRADHLVLTRVERCDEQQVRESVNFLKQWFPAIPCWQARTEVTKVRVIGNESVPVRTGTAHAFCGIGDPESFRSTLESQGWELSGHSVFRDHHSYSIQEIGQLQRKAQAEGARFLVCTEKDEVKIESLDLSSIASPLPILVQEIGTSLDVRRLLAPFDVGSSSGKRELPTSSC